LHRDRHAVWRMDGCRHHWQSDEAYRLRIKANVRPGEHVTIAKTQRGLSNKRVDAWRRGGQQEIESLEQFCCSRLEPAAQALGLDQHSGRQQRACQQPVARARIKVARPCA